MWDALGRSLFRILAAVYIFGGGYLILHLGYALGKTREATALTVVLVCVALIPALIRLGRRRRERARNEAERKARLAAERRAEQQRKSEIEEILGRYTSRR